MQALCIKSAKILGSLVVFYMLVLIVFGIICMELYGFQYRVFEEGNPRENYDNFFLAVLTLFGITTGESWIDQVWNAMRQEVRYR